MRYAFGLEAESALSFPRSPERLFRADDTIRRTGPSLCDRLEAQPAPCRCSWLKLRSLLLVQVLGAIVPYFVALFCRCCQFPTSGVEIAD